LNILSWSRDIGSEARRRRQQSAEVQAYIEAALDGDDASTVAILTKSNSQCMLRARMAALRPPLARALQEQDDDLRPFHHCFPAKGLSG
jgi:hypothetical protein